MRGAPSIEIIHMLQHEGAHIKAYDPQAVGTARRILTDVEYCENAYVVAKDADALILVTEWNEFKQLDMMRIKESMRQPILLDGRNIYNPRSLKEIGFIHRGMGRGYNEAV